MSGKIFQGWQWKELFGDGISEGRYGKQNKKIFEALRFTVMLSLNI